MFDKFESNILRFIIILSVFAMNSCLNITEMSVPSVVWAPEKVTLTCVKQDDTENDTFIDIRWFKSVGNQWKLIKTHPIVLKAPMRARTSDMRADGEEETPKEETPEETKEDPPKDTNESQPEETPKDDANEEKPKEDPPKEDPPKEGEPTKEASEENPKPQPEKEGTPEEKPDPKPQKQIKKETEIYNLIGLVDTDDSNIELSGTSLSSAGLYKCVLKSSKEVREEVKEMRVYYKPVEDSKPELSLPIIKDNHISVKCTAPASYPMMALNFFINYELAPHEEVHRLPAIRTRNTTYETDDELLMNVEELRFRATKESVLNGNISIVCTAVLADIHHSLVQLEFPFNGDLYNSKCLSPALIILIVVAIIVVLTVVVVAVWLFLRKKKLNSLNKVAELFNKQTKTITVLVDNTNNTNNAEDIKVE